MDLQDFIRGAVAGGLDGARLAVAVRPVEVGGQQAEVQVVVLVRHLEVVVVLHPVGPRRAAASGEHDEHERQGCE